MTYLHFTDGELLREIDDRRKHSPLINELAKRLERVGGISGGDVTCPVCDANLKLGVDDDFEFNLEFLT